MTIVNFGCGADPAPGCINIDGGPTTLIAKLPIPMALIPHGRRAIVTATREHGVIYKSAKSMSFAEGSIDAFYSSHVLEHLPRTETKDLLRRVRGWLKPGGVIRTVLPDLRRLAEDYVAGKADAAQFVKAINLVDETSGIHGVLYKLTSKSPHRWMYDAESLSKLLTELGFVDIRRCEYQQSRMPELVPLDLASRAHESFYVEAVRARS